MNSSTYSPNSASVSPTTTPAVGAAAPSTTASSTAGKVATPRKEDTAEVIKEKVAETVQQLNRGWKTLFGLKEQVRRHPLATILSSAAVLLAIGGSITVGVLEGQRRRTFSYRFRKGLRSVKRQLTR